MSETKGWYTVNEAATYLGVSRRTVYKLCETSRLPTYVIGASQARRFKQDDLDKVPSPVSSKRRPKAEELFLSMTAAADPVLAELWDNDLDAVYDKL